MRARSSPSSISRSEQVLDKRTLSERVGDEARALPSRSQGWFKTWFRKVWNIRGGGLYACGFAVTFLVLELGSIVEDVQDVGMIFNGQAMRFGLNLVIDSFMNTGKAFAWPMYVAQFSPPWGPIGLGAAFVLFPMTLKKPIENWLFDGEVESDEQKTESD